MPASMKSLEAMAPNSVEKREETAKQGRCQMCLTKVPMAKQKSLINDLENGTVSVVKAREGKSHYCGDCTAERKKMKEAWLERRESGGSTKPKGKGKKAAKKGGKGKAAAPKGAKKRATKKATKGKKATKKRATKKDDDEPF